MEAAEVLQPVDDLPAPVAVDDRHQVQDSRRDVRLVRRVLLLEQPPQGGLDLRGRRALLAPDARGVEGQSCLQVSGAISASASSGPEEPASYFGSGPGIWPH